MEQGSGNPAARTRAPRRGSFASDRQIAHAVRHSRKVKATLPDGSSVEGYVLGMDDYHWVVVGTDESVNLVHKSTPCMTILSTTLDKEPEGVRDVLGPMLVSFRQSVERDHFSAIPAQSA